MATITKAHAEEIAQIIADICNEDADEVLRPYYSGRGMYGDSCIGFIAPPAIVIAAFATSEALRRGELDADLMELASELHTDSMGRDTISYLPSWTVVED